MKAASAMVAGLAFALLATGAAAAGEPDRSEKALRERIEAYWTLRAAGDVKKAVAFYVPTASGDAPVDVPENGGIWFKEWAIERIQMEGDRARVGVRVKTPQVLASPIHQSKLPESLQRPLLPEEWVIHEGEWRKVVPDRSLSRIGRRQAAPGNAPQN